MLEKPVNGLSVNLHGQHVGTLAQTQEGTVAFQYSQDWLRNGFSISPRSLPLDSRVYVADWQPFGGLFGAFHDSLPDGWGALLLDRMLAKQGYDPSTIGPLARLAIMGSDGRGALEYIPQADFPRQELPLNLDELARNCADILADKEVDNLDTVYAAGGSSGGARPKTYYELDGESWLVKFPSRFDPPNIGQIEFAYMECAKQCGIIVPDVRVLPSKEHDGFFAVKRFDRQGKEKTRVHMLSASALLEVSHRVPALDYRSLFQLSYFLTGQRAEANQLFRRTCFNVFAHNHDDHSNNFTWLCKDGAWELSPAYDLTYSSTQFGGHTTTVLGNANPGMVELLALAKEVGLPAKDAKRIARKIQDACHTMLVKLELPTGNPQT